MKFKALYKNKNTYGNTKRALLAQKFKVQAV